MYKHLLKNSLADQDTLIECDKMNYIFQHSPHTSRIDVAVLGSHWSKNVIGDRNVRL